MSTTYGTQSSIDSTSSNRVRFIVGQAQVTFGNFELAQKFYVQFCKENDRYRLRLYNSKKYTSPCREEEFGESDFCGLDWGTFETQKVWMNWFYFPSKYHTYVTIINKTKSISLLFNDDMTVQMNYWKNQLIDCLYQENNYIRQYLRYGPESVVLQAGGRNLSLTDPRSHLEPARSRPGQCWDKAMFSRCEADGKWLTIAMNSTQFPIKGTSVELECERSGTIYGQFLRQEDIVKRIWREIYSWVLDPEITDIAFYEGLHDFIGKEQNFDLNEMEDTDESEYEIRREMFNAYRKCKDKADDFTNTDRKILTTGAIIARIKATPPQIDTLKLPEDIRCDICLDLYSDNVLGRSSDWTALASQIGIKQSAIRKINALFYEEKPDIYKAEIILRHWQYTYNMYWEKPDSTPGRPKLPCTQEGLIEALRTIGQHKLVALVESVVEEVYDQISSHSQGEVWWV